MFGVAWWLPAIAVPAQVWTDHRKPFGKDWRDAMPTNVRLWIAMQEQNRITAASLNEVNNRFSRFYLLITKTIK